MDLSTGLTPSLMLSNNSPMLSGMLQTPSGTRNPKPEIRHPEPGTQNPIPKLEADALADAHKQLPAAGRHAPNTFRYPKPRDAAPGPEHRVRIRVQVLPITLQHCLP